MRQMKTVQSALGQQNMENQSEAEAEPSGVVTVVVGIVVVSTLTVAPEFVDGVDPRVTLERALPVSAPPTMPPAPRAPYPLLQSIGADAHLRSLLRRDFEGVVHSEMPAGARVSCGNSLAETVQSASPAGAGVSSGTSSLDGSGAPPVATDVRAGAFVVTPLGAVGGSIGVVFVEQLGSPLRSRGKSSPASARTSFFLARFERFLLAFLAEELPDCSKRRSARRHPSTRVPTRRLGALPAVSMSAATSLLACGEARSPVLLRKVDPVSLLLAGVGASVLMIARTAVEGASGRGGADGKSSAPGVESLG
mmetsp:Transcript_16815/g.48663  ORF Transcript_16815/g.48663 Transcript_16815/m.48663 type:complete len:308 (-) Transcript_16815:933-1856(-)